MRPLILIIDDSDRDLKIQKQKIALRWEDPTFLLFHFTRASDFASVCQVVASNPVSAIVCDLRLPGYPDNGGIIPELRDYLNTLGKPLPIVALSTYIPEDVKEFGATTGASKSNSDGLAETLKPLVSSSPDIGRLEIEMFNIKKKLAAVNEGMTTLYCQIQEAYATTGVRLDGVIDRLSLSTSEIKKSKEIASQLAVQFGELHNDILEVRDGLDQIRVIRQDLDRVKRTVSFSSSFSRRMDKLLIVAIVSSSVSILLSFWILINWG